MTTILQMFEMKMHISQPTVFVDQLFKAYVDRIYRFAFRQLGSKEQADDVVSDTFLRAAKSLHCLREGGSLNSWLFTIAGNLCIDAFRKAKREQAHSLDWDEACNGYCVDGLEEQLVLGVVVHETLASMTPWFLEPMLLADMYDLSAKEGAEIVEISVPAFKSRLYRGRQQYRELTEAASMAVGA